MVRSLGVPIFRVNMVSLFSAYRKKVFYLELCIMPVLLIYSHTTKLTALDKRRQYSNNICLFIHQNIYHDILWVHTCTCHKLWTKICEIRQNFKGDLTKFCEIFLNITLEFPQYTSKVLFFFFHARSM